MNIIISLLVFVLISSLASMVGLGGGVFYVPALIFLGYSFNEASTISLFLIVFTGLSAFLRFRKGGLVDWKIALVMEFFTGIGAFTGGLTSVQFNQNFLKILFSAVLIIIAVFLLLKKEVKPDKLSPVKSGFGYWVRNFNGMTYSIPVFLMIAVTFSAGYLSSILGISGGALKVASMILLFGIPSRVAVATSSLMVGFTGLTGLAGHLVKTSIDWKMAAILIVAVFIGGKLGSKISMGFSEKKVNKVASFIYIGLAVIMVLETIFIH